MQIQKKNFDGFAIANISPDAPEYSPTAYASYHQYNRFTREYLKTSAVYQSINIIGAECATVRVQLRNNRTQEVLTYEKNGANALLDLFYTPNKFETQQEFVMGVQGDLKLIRQRLYSQIEHDDERPPDAFVSPAPGMSECRT
jgi:hypothetical protein